MTEHVYRIHEVVGTAEGSVEKAIENAIAAAGGGAEWFEVVTLRGHVANGKVAHYQVQLKVGARQG